MSVSDDKCLYRMYDANGELLYIGISIKVMSRLDGHWSSKDWIGQVETITIERHATAEELENAEREAIKAEKPKHNIIFRRFKERPIVRERKERQKEAFSKHLNEYLNKTGKSCFQASYEIGVCHTAFSRWKNAKVCPGRSMLEVIERWSDGEIEAEKFDFSQF